MSIYLRNSNLNYQQKAIVYKKEEAEKQRQREYEKMKLEKANKKVNDSKPDEVKNKRQSFEIVVTEDFENNFNYYGYEEFTRKVIRKCANKKEHGLTGIIKLVDAEVNKRIFLTTEKGEEFTIRYFIQSCNEKQWKASYTLFKTVMNEDGSGYGEEISFGYAISQYRHQN